MNARTWDHRGSYRVAVIALVAVLLVGGLLVPAAASAAQGTAGPELTVLTRAPQCPLGTGDPYPVIAGLKQGAAPRSLAGTRRAGGGGALDGGKTGWVSGSSRPGEGERRHGPDARSGGATSDGGRSPPHRSHRSNSWDRQDHCLPGKQWRRDLCDQQQRNRITQADDRHGSGTIARRTQGCFYAVDEQRRWFGGQPVGHQYRWQQRAPVIR